MSNRNSKATAVLKKAVRYGDEVMVMVAFTLGADPNTVIWNFALKHYVCLLSKAIMSSHDHLVPHLLAAGAPVNGFKELPMKPMIAATSWSNARVLRWLLTAGADLGTTSNDGRTALHQAAYSNDESSVKMLLSAKADVNAQDNCGNRPLHCAAAQNFHGIVRLLLKASGCDRHARNTDQFTALHVAALKGGLETSQCLVEAGLDPEAKHISGRTPGDEARLGGHHLVASWLKKLTRPRPAPETATVVLVELCLETCETAYLLKLQDMKEDDSLDFLRLNTPALGEHEQDASGRTLLHWAAAGGQERAVYAFLKWSNHYPNSVTRAGETPFDLAVRAGHHLVIGILHDHMINIPQIQGSPRELFNQLLSAISLGDDYKRVGDLLHARAPLEDPDGCSTLPLPLAITSNRREIVSLLLAVGAPLTTTCQGLNLLALAWLTPDVNPPVQVTITRAFLHTLEAERDIMARQPQLRAGVNHIISIIKSDTPWRASWPSGGTVVHLTELMVQAARHKCTLTCSFIHQAGGQSSLCSKSGVSPLHAALEAGHWSLTRHMLKNMGGCLYVADSRGRLPTTMMSSHLRQQLEQNIYHKERNQLEELQLKMKDKVDQQQVEELLRVQKTLFKSYWNKITGTRRNTDTPECQKSFDKAHSLLVATQGGMLQLIYLLVKEGGVQVDTQVDSTSGTTGIHQAASHGKSGSVLLLQSLGAESLRQDRYGQTPPHLAAMFFHQNTFDLFAEFLKEQAPRCRAGTTPTQVRNNFTRYLEMYHKCGPDQTVDAQIENDQTSALMNLLKRKDLENLLKDVRKITVDYTKGEAQEVKEAITKELKAITDIVADIDTTYTGRLTLLGSTADSTRLYCPDEFDFNLIIRKFSNVTVTVEEQPQKDIALSGHKLNVEIKTKNPGLEGNKLMSNLYERVRESLGRYVLQDDRLSLVPPGVIRTQVGVALSLAWQGSEYPLLLIDIDLVPVLPAAWPEEIVRPFLTPGDSQVIHLSNTGDEKWRGSFAATEVEVVKQLDPQERQVFLAGKSLLSYMKAEPWMPREVKNQFSWWDSRFWTIPIPAGFCFKNSFMKLLERKRKEGRQWREEDTLLHMTEVFEGMCLMIDERQRFVPAKVHAYFGGDCEKPKVGEGAPVITKFLKKFVKRRQ
ncbi:ankyrin-1-like [Homarus americanus]|uniref:ankyrin-1-like n=1 Tax=Homarus americanus TaxID=6706 RepID=UPI001C45D14F|nr:ankyrin-1-like [Homarus americanus]